MRYNDGMANGTAHEILARVDGELGTSLRAEDAVRAQLFFANLNAETLKPHYGDVQRQVVQEILKRAAEAGLYEAST